MKAIIAVNNLGFIGLNGGIPWKSKQDMQHFAKMTKQGEGALLVGFNTNKKLPPLKGRIIQVDTKTVFKENEIIKSVSIDRASACLKAYPYSIEGVS